MIAGRFELLNVAGSGGMGVVWRARDVTTGEGAALKLALPDSDDASMLLDRESKILETIDEPAVPRFLGRGRLEDGARWLAMEWLEGEDLSARLARGWLGVEEVVGLGVRVAEALAAVHARGIVHCDLKPANLFLVGGDLDAVKVMDFGIARRVGSDLSWIQGGLVGTPFYMAPEQARGDFMIDRQADLYALGCVLFECLTGRPPFVAASPVAVLTKVLFEEPPTLAGLRVGVPPALESLLRRLLAKDVAARPPSAAAVARELGALREALAGPPPSRLRTSLGRDERRLVSVILATSRAASALRPDSTMAIQATSAPPLAALMEIGVLHGARLEVLGDGSVAAVIVGASSPIDLAVAGARCALALRAVLPDAQTALVTGWEVFTGMQPLGRVIDRASALIEARSGAAGCVLLDPMTAALLDERFAVEGDEAAPVLAGEREVAGEVRRLLGKSVPFLGREREISALEELFDGCVIEPAARAVLVTGAPGVGKSRLRDELTRRIRERAEGAGGVEIWIARGDPMRQKVPFGLVGQLARRAARLVDGEPLDVRRQKLAARVARCVGPAHQRRVAEFLGELCGTPFPAEESAQLRAARMDPMLMGDQLRRAWLDFLEAECRAHPVLLVLEDLQWGDRPTVDFLDASLRVLASEALMVLAMARPEVTEVFPSLWGDRSLTALRIGQLPRRACEQIVRRALGEATPDEQVAQIVARSAQNPFMLEELVRAADEGRGDEVPDTVLAMMQSRLLGLDPEARRLLRAGSLFGELFWRGAVAALIDAGADLTALLAELERREWITARYESRFRGEQEYAFRHGIIREAAYEMLTEEDREAGHRLAGEWLSRAGEIDALVLAEHFDRGGEPARAVGYYRTAAHQALEGNDLGGAIARVERAMACGASGTVLGELCLTRAEALRWQGHFGEARGWAERAEGIFPNGSDGWLSALREETASISATESHERILRIADMLDALWLDSASAGSLLVLVTTWEATKLYEAALHERAEVFHQRLEAVEHEFTWEPVTQAFIAMHRAFRQGWMLLDMSACGEALRAAAELFEKAGDLRLAYQMRVNLGHVYNELGYYAENVQMLTALLTEAKRMGLWSVAALAMSHISKAQLALGRLVDADQSTSMAMDGFTMQGDQRMVAVCRAYRGLVLRQRGMLDEAEREARDAVELLQSVPSLEPFAAAVLASVLLARGRATEAVELARRAVEAVGLAEEGEAFIRLTYAESLDAAGDHAGAVQAILIARDKLIKRSDKMTNAAYRRSFFENVAENARTMELAGQAG